MKPIIVLVISLTIQACASARVVGYDGVNKTVQVRANKFASPRLIDSTASRYCGGDIEYLGFGQTTVGAVMMSNGYIANVNRNIYTYRCLGN